MILTTPSRQNNNSLTTSVLLVESSIKRKTMQIIDKTKHQNYKVALIYDPTTEEYQVRLTRMGIESCSNNYRDMETAYSLFHYVTSNRPIEGRFWNDPLVKKSAFFSDSLSKSPRYIQNMIRRCNGQH